MRRVVITGIGAVTPIGNNVQEYLEGLKNGVSGAAQITHFDASLFKTKFACEVKNFNPEIAIEKKEIRRVDLYTQYGLVAVDEVGPAGARQRARGRSGGTRAGIVRQRRHRQGLVRHRRLAVSARGYSNRRMRPRFDRTGAQARRIRRHRAGIEVRAVHAAADGPRMRPVDYCEMDASSISLDAPLALRGDRKSVV